MIFTPFPAFFKLLTAILNEFPQTPQSILSYGDEETEFYTQNTC